MKENNECIFVFHTSKIKFQDAWLERRKSRRMNTLPDSVRVFCIWLVTHHPSKPCWTLNWDKVFWATHLLNSFAKQLQHKIAKQLQYKLTKNYCCCQNWESPPPRAVHRSRSAGAGVGKLQQKLRLTKLWKVNINVNSCTSWVPPIRYEVSKIPYCLFCLRFFWCKNPLTLMYFSHWIWMIKEWLVSVTDGYFTFCTKPQTKR